MLITKKRCCVGGIFKHVKHAIAYIREHKMQVFEVGTGLVVIIVCLIRRDYFWCVASSTFSLSKKRVWVFS